MATIVNTPGSGGNSTAGWIVAVVVIILVVLGGIYLLNMEDLDRDTDAELIPAAGGDRGGTEPPDVNNVYNTTINATTSITNSTTTEE